jgi:cytochrome c-type biogenesis protein CcmE
MSASSVTNHGTAPSDSGGGFLSSNRNRLLLLLVISTVAIGALAFRAASGDLSYYVEPDEFLAQIDGNEGDRWRVGGRVVEGTIVEENGRPVAFDIAGESGERISVAFDGIVPNLFTANAFVVVEGSLHEDGHFEATSLVIKHENEFFSDTPPPDSPSADLLPDY